MLRSVPDLLRAVGHFLPDVKLMVWWWLVDILDSFLLGSDAATHIATCCFISYFILPAGEVFFMANAFKCYAREFSFGGGLLWKI